MLINCAGTSVSGAFDEVVEEAFEDMYRVNVLGSVFPTRAVLPLMKRQRAGAIVFVSSQAGQVGLWGYTAYSASKFALRGLAQALQMEVHPFNIFVSVAYPPDTDTPGFQVEELSKPAETSMICGAGSVFKADQVRAALPSLAFVCRSWSARLDLLWPWLTYAFKSERSHQHKRRWPKMW